MMNTQIFASMALVGGLDWETRPAAALEQAFLNSAALPRRTLDPIDAVADGLKPPHCEKLRFALDDVVHCVERFAFSDLRGDLRHPEGSDPDWCTIAEARHRRLQGFRERTCGSVSADAAFLAWQRLARASRRRLPAGVRSCGPASFCFRWEDEEADEGEESEESEESDADETEDDSDDCSESDSQLDEREDAGSQSDSEAKPVPEFQQKARHEAKLMKEPQAVKEQEAGSREQEAGSRERIRIWLYLSLALRDTHVTVAAASLHPPLHLLMRSSDALATSLAAVVTQLARRARLVQVHSAPVVGDRRFTTARRWPRDCEQVNSWRGSSCCRRLVMKGTRLSRRIVSPRYKS